MNKEGKGKMLLHLIILHHTSTFIKLVKYCCFVLCTIKKKIDK